uniref:Peptidoglycan -binding protein n=1 Tax=Acidicaldus sp. TaxID=1872105 RepID=A0A8J4HC83_9PROT
MALSRRRSHQEGLNPWPGYVDALSTLLMTTIFVLLVFVLAQAFLSVALSNRSKALEQLNGKVSQLADMLALEQGKARDLESRLATLTANLQAANAARAELAQQLGARGEQLQASQSQIQALQAELARTVKADKETIDAKLADLAKLNEQVAALTALRDELEKKAQDAAARAMTEADRRAAVAAELAQEKTLADSARAEIALLNQQMAELRAQLQSLSGALAASEQEAKEKDVQIANLGQRLNAALAAKVEELQRYRSEFFGRLREVLANKPGIQIVGDRFVFQSEVLFPVGSADLTPSGQEEIRKLAATLKDIAREIPNDVNWILRVDGHADHQPLSGGGAFASNWELSAQRAINVVKLLVAEGIPPTHLAATGFADYQPLATGDTPEDYAKNRRIELRLTDR